jgi:hypothetical protein
VDGPGGRKRPKEDEDYWLEGEGGGQTRVQQNCSTDHDPPRVVESEAEEEEEEEDKIMDEEGCICKGKSTGHSHVRESCG